MILAELDATVIFAAIITAIVGPIVLILANRYFMARRPTEREQIAKDRAEMFDRLEESERECRQAWAVERWRTSILIRALQNAGLEVPAEALLRVTYDPATDTYKVQPD